MTYRYITVTGRIGSLDEILSAEYGTGIRRELALANSAPALNAVVKQFLDYADSTGDPTWQEHRRLMRLALADTDF